MSARALFAACLARIRRSAPAHAVACGLELAAPLPGYRWRALCCWCSERHPVVEWARLHGGNGASECETCDVIGRDVLLVLVEEPKEKTPEP